MSLENVLLRISLLFFFCYVSFWSCFNYCLHCPHIFRGGCRYYSVSSVSVSFQWMCRNMYKMKKEYGQTAASIRVHAYLRTSITEPLLNLPQTGYPDKDCLLSPWAAVNWPPVSSLFINSLFFNPICKSIWSQQKFHRDMRKIFSWQMKNNPSQNSKLISTHEYRPFFGKTFKSCRGSIWKSLLKKKVQLKTKWHFYSMIFKLKLWTQGIWTFIYISVSRRSVCRGQTDWERQMQKKENDWGWRIWWMWRQSEFVLFLCEHTNRHGAHWAAPCFSCCLYPLIYF